MPGVLPCLLAVLMLSLGPSPAVRAQGVNTEEQDRQAIRMLSDEYGTVASAGDVEGYLNLLTDDAVLMPPNEPVLVGKASIRPFLRGVFDFVRSVTDFQEVTTPEEIRVTENWAYDRGTTSLRWVADGEIKRGTNKYVRIWQRQADGTWKLARVIWNPSPPAPSGFIEEDVRLQVRGAVLAGVLTRPAEDARHPVAVIISSAGVEDRDGLVEYAPARTVYRTLARHLATAGMAVLRLDDRGVGQSTGKHIWQYTLEDNVADVLAAIRWLKRHERIDTSRVGLVGHSHGGIVAAVVAARSSDVQFLTMHATYGVKGEEVFLPMRRRLEQHSARSENDLEARVRYQVDVVNNTARHGGDWDAVAETIRRWRQEDFSRLPAGEKEQYETFEDYFAQTWDGAIFLPIVQTPWYREFIDIEPDRILLQVTMPVLITFGQNDPIVPYAVNATALVEALERGGNKDYTVEEISGTAHNYERAEAGGLSEDALETLSVWLREKARIHKPHRH